MRWFKKAADTFGGLVFLCLFLTFLVQITARFVFNKPLPWTDELAVILYLWAILWAAAFMVPEREQVVLKAAAETARRIVFDLVTDNTGAGSAFVPIHLAGHDAEHHAHHMPHVVATHLIAAVGQSVGKTFGGGVEQQARGFHHVGGYTHHTCFLFMLDSYSYFIMTT
jgi:hypothetical protein